jgi:hypothetical protein
MDDANLWEYCFKQCSDVKSITQSHRQEYPEGTAGTFNATKRCSSESATHCSSKMLKWLSIESCFKHLTVDSFVLHTLLHPQQQQGHCHPLQDHEPLATISLRHVKTFQYFRTWNNQNRQTASTITNQSLLSKCQILLS